jgi:tetratricopeptide (TPR) repeat protein
MIGNAVPRLMAAFVCLSALGPDVTFHRAFACSLQSSPDVTARASPPLGRQAASRQHLAANGQSASSTQDAAAAETPPVQRTQHASLGRTTTRPVTLEERADIYLARKEYEDAVDYYRRALRQQGSASLWNKLGIAYQLDMNLPSARKAYKQAAHQKSDFAEPWNNLGTTYYLQNKARKSVRYYKQAVKLRPEVASFHLNLSASYSRMKKFKEALEECREALQLDPNVLTEHSANAATVQARGTDVEFYYYLAKAFASMSRPDDAVRYLRRALEDGFKDMHRLDRDPDFQKISNYPAYVELRKNPPVAIED